MSWQEEALCEGMSGTHHVNLRFFEEYETSVEVRKEIDNLCADCPVKRTCLKDSVSKRGTGVHWLYIDEGHYSRKINNHKPLEQRRTEEELVKEIRREIRAERIKNKVE